MRDLLERFNKDFDIAEGWIRIVDADWFADDLRITLSLKLYEDAETELWEISCSCVLEESLKSEFASTLYLLSDSPLLKPYSEAHVDMMFTENNCAPHFLLGVVLSSCVEVIGRPEYISRFMNQKPIVKGVAESKYGLLGRFPESVANHILKSLEAQPIRIKALKAKLPTRYVDSAFSNYPSLKALLIGESYVIASEFNACRA